MGEVRCLKDLGFIQHLGFDGVRCQLDVETPLLDFFALRNHGIQFTNGSNTVVGLLEETLSHCCHRLLVLPHFLRDAYQHAELWRQVDVLTLLLNFKQGLVEVHDLLVILLLEVLNHRNRRASFSLLELARGWTHVVADVGDLVGLVMTITGHHDGSFKFVVDRLLNFLVCCRPVRVALSFLDKSLRLLLDEFITIINRQVF